MFTAAEIAFWSPEDALQELKASTPAGWKLSLRAEGRYLMAELQDENEVQVWSSSNTDPKILYLEGLGWLLSRSHKPTHPAWRPREHEVTLHVPNTQAHEPLPADLDPDEVRAVYKNRR